MRLCVDYYFSFSKAKTAVDELKSDLSRAESQLEAAEHGLAQVFTES